jgi:hypothetical protein
MKPSTPFIDPRCEIKLSRDDFSNSEPTFRSDSLHFILLALLTDFVDREAV